MAAGNSPSDAIGVPASSRSKVAASVGGSPLEAAKATAGLRARPEARDPGRKLPLHHKEDVFDALKGSQPARGSPLDHGPRGGAELCALSLNGGLRPEHGKKRGYARSLSVFPFAAF